MSYYDGAAGAEDTSWGRGTRRKKIAGYLKAANDLRQSYRENYSSRGQQLEFDPGGPSIQESFPGLKVAQDGREEMVLFPSYAMKHIKRNPPPRPVQQAGASTAYDAEAPDAWRNEWEIYEDENAVVDVDVRGWIYSPHTGPLNRKSRLMLGIARRLSGIPAPSTENQSPNRLTGLSQEQVTSHEEEMADREARHIARRGEKESDVAGLGEYSEGRGALATASRSATTSRNPSPHPGSLRSSNTDSSAAESSSSSGLMSRVSTWNQQTGMTHDELTAANKHLMARLKPFLTNPTISTSVTIFFYNEETSQSRTARTNDAGHFNCRAALAFVPTHVRVLASERLSATDEVYVTGTSGVSLISDIDDTIKHSAIGSGAREIFRNAFIRNLDELTIDGVREWYERMAAMGVRLHYVSNSPWQMYPLLASFFSKAGLPPGSFHLKQYSGMLQGIFEPVAERKKSSLDRILQDFPERKFILVGDSGEADLEVYTETAIAYPGRILGIFIRDVTTTYRGFFDPSLGPLSGAGYPFGEHSGSGTSTPGRDSQPANQLQSRAAAGGPISDSHSDVGDLIDLSDDFEPKAPLRASTDPPALNKDTKPATRKGPPAPPTKPTFLRSNSGSVDPEGGSETASAKARPPIPSKPSQFSAAAITPADINAAKPKPPPPPPPRNSYRAAVTNRVVAAYNALPSASAYWNDQNQLHTPTPAGQSSAPMSTSAPAAESLSAKSGEPPPLPPRRTLASYPSAVAQYASEKLGYSQGAGDGGHANDNPEGYGAGGQGSSGSSGGRPPDDGYAYGYNKREDLWRRRWARAKQELDRRGIILRAWRTGNDAMDTAVSLVVKEMDED